MQRDVQAAVQRLPAVRPTPLALLDAEPLRRDFPRQHRQRAIVAFFAHRQHALLLLPAHVQQHRLFQIGGLHFPLQRALRRQAGQIQRNGYLAGEVQRLHAVGRDNGQTLQRQLLFFIQLRLGAEIRPLIMQALPVRAEESCSLPA